MGEIVVKGAVRYRDKDLKKSGLVGEVRVKEPVAGTEAWAEARHAEALAAQEAEFEARRVEFEAELAERREAFDRELAERAAPAAEETGGTEETATKVVEPEVTKVINPDTTKSGRSRKPAPAGE